MSRHCTAPNILGFRKWFEQRFSKLCEEHDNFYNTKNIARKEADLVLYNGIKQKGYPVTALVTYIAVRTLGFVRWNNGFK